MLISTVSIAAFAILTGIEGKTTVLVRIFGLPVGYQPCLRSVYGLLYAMSPLKSSHRSFTMDIKRRTWEIVEVARKEDRASRAFDLFILSLILFNVLAVVLGTVEVIASRFGPYLDLFEIFSVLIFSTEYLARLWSSPADPRYSHPMSGRLRFAFTPMALVDLLAVLPFYVAVIGVDLRFVRALRLARIIRVAKIGRYTAALQIFSRVLYSRRAELVLTTGMMFLMLVLATFPRITW